MTPSTLATYIQFKANIPSNVSPWTNSTILSLVNVAKDNMAQAIVQVNPNYFGEVSTAATVSQQQEYTKPDNLLLMKRIDVAYSDPTVVGAFRPAQVVTINELVPMGEDYYASNQSPDQPLVRFDDTGFFLYPMPGVGGASNYGSAYLKLWWVPKRSDLGDLTEASTDIETTTGIGGIFHQLLGDIVVNWIKEKQGNLTAMDVQNNNQHILDILVPAAFRQQSSITSDLPTDYNLQY